MRGHRVHRWRVAARMLNGHHLMTCGYRTCAATLTKDPDRQTIKNARIERMARRVFADELAGVVRLSLWDSCDDYGRPYTERVEP